LAASAFPPQKGRGGGVKYTHTHTPPREYIALKVHATVA
jgi:hypothetical protein